MPKDKHGKLKKFDKKGKPIKNYKAIKEKKKKK